MKLINIIRAIKKYNSFLISTHVNPDPDAICSELALAEYLRSIGKKVTIVNQVSIPDRFLFFPGAKAIKQYKEKMRVEFDIAIIVDCGELSRIGKVQQLLDEFSTVINIDHHITNDSFGRINFVDPQASSTAEILYDLLTKAGCRLTKSIAVNLYAGIMTDTGSFRYDNTKTKTLTIAAHLMKFKFSASDLYAKLYESRFKLSSGYYDKIGKNKEKFTVRLDLNFDLTDLVSIEFNPIDYAKYLKTLEKYDRVDYSFHTKLLLSKPIIGIIWKGSALVETRDSNYDEFDYSKLVFALSASKSF